MQDDHRSQLLADKDPPVDLRRHEGAFEQPGLEVVPTSEFDKQFDQPEKEVAHSKDNLEMQGKETVWPAVHPAQSDLPPEPEYKPEYQRTEPRRYCGMKRGLFWGLLIVVLVFVLGLAIGLGVGLGSDGSDSSEPSETTTPPSPAPTSLPIDESLKIGGSLDPSYYSADGAWNGTGIALNWQRFASNFGDAPDGDSTVLYYQHHSGEIRYMRRSKTRDWVRLPSNSEAVADNALNSTPITAVHLNINQTKHWSMFYVDEDYQVRERTGNNNTMDWANGPIDKANLTVYRGDLAGLHACWAGYNNNMPIRLWYASDESTFEEYVFYSDENEWKWQRTWNDYSGAAGIGCYSWTGLNNFIYAAFVNSNSDVEIWYQNATGSATWQQTDVIIPDVHPASSISLSERFCIVQKRDSHELQVSLISWDGANTTRQYNRSISLEDVTDNVRGTHIFAHSVLNDRGSVNGTAYIYSQVTGDDITQFYRNLDNADATWSQDSVDMYIN